MANVLITLLLIIWGNNFYPVPVDCRHEIHEPTIAGAKINQGFGDHVGLDYGVIVGSDVYAVQDGIVIWAGDYGRTYGNSVLLLHCDGYMSLYAHLSEIKVKFGQVVNSGELIGLSGGIPGTEGAGQTTGYHLHVEVRVPGHLDSNKNNINPLRYMEPSVLIRGFKGME